MPSNPTLVASSAFGQTFVSSASGRSVTLPVVPTLGNIVHVVIEVKSASGSPGIPQLTDNYGNLWQFILTGSSSGNHIRQLAFFAKIKATGAGFAITSTPTAAVIQSIEGAEFSGYTANVGFSLSVATLASGTGTSVTTNAPTIPAGATAILFGTVTNLGTLTTITPTGGSTDLFDGTTNLFSDTAYQIGVTTASPSMTWTLGTSQSWIAVCVALIYVDFVDNHVAAGCDYAISAKDISWANGQGVNGSYAVSLGAGFLTNYTGDIGTIIICATAGTTTLFSADDAGQTFDGAYSLRTNSNNQLGGFFNTDQTDINGDGSFSESVGYGNNGRPCIYALTLNVATKSYAVTVNGFQVISGTVAGNPDTALAAFIFGTIQGGLVASGGGVLHELRIYSTPQTLAKIQAATSQMAWPLGSPTTNRGIHLGFRNDTETMCLSESSNVFNGSAVPTFANLREVSYAPPGATVRDVGLYYHAANKTWYAMHTTGSFGGFTYFMIAKSIDLRLWVLHAKVDISGQIGTKPSVACS